MEGLHPVPGLELKLIALCLIFLLSVLVGLVAAMLKHSESGRLGQSIPYGAGAFVSTAGLALVAAKFLLS
ncbi:hypothetical protein [Streptomyces mirabilis]